jgi:hypothetical protein
MVLLGTGTQLFIGITLEVGFIVRNVGAVLGCLGVMSCRRVILAGCGPFSKLCEHETQWQLVILVCGNCFCRFQGSQG